MRANNPIIEASRRSLRVRLGLGLGLGLSLRASSRASMWLGSFATLALAVSTVSACQDSAPVETQFAVEGMTCESCVKGITETLSLVKGVESVEVNLYAERATVVHDPSVVSAQDLKGRIDRMGYTATVGKSSKVQPSVEAKP